MQPHELCSPLAFGAPASAAIAAASGVLATGPLRRAQRNNEQTSGRIATTYRPVLGADGRSNISADPATWQISCDPETSEFFLFFNPF
jgi:hypothetical protein